MEYYNKKLHENTTKIARTLDCAQKFNVSTKQCWL